MNENACMAPVVIGLGYAPRDENVYMAPVPLNPAYV